MLPDQDQTPASKKNQNKKKNFDVGDERNRIDNGMWVFLVLYFFHFFSIF